MAYIRVDGPSLSRRRCRVHAAGSCLLDDGDLLVRKPVKLVHQSVDLPVRGVDLALEDGLLVRVDNRRDPPVRQHDLVDKLSDPVVPRHVAAVGEVEVRMGVRASTLPLISRPTPRRLARCSYHSHMTRELSNPEM
jgi:hypothetical protein